MSDNNYPEYLNPFAENFKPKSKLSISNSFRELKRNLRKSFRIKKKDEEDLPIRQRTDTIRRFPMSYPNPHEHLTIALPRSRFSERVAKHEPSTSNPGPNPFEEDEENTDKKNLTTKRRGKKKAPLPPKSLSSQNVNDDNLEVPTRGSHWSLTSVDTDYSGSTDASQTEIETTEIKRTSMVEPFIHFNKEMEKLKDDSNNNVITKEETKEETESNNNIPDLVISCPSETDSCKNQNINEDKKVESTPNHVENDTNEDKINSDNSDNSESDSELVVTDITNNMVTDESHTVNANVTEENIVQGGDTELFLYHEKKSIYIAGSRDELNDSDTYTGRVSLYIVGSTDELDTCNNNNNNNNVCDKNGIDNNDDDDVAPIPKQRKNKLTKSTLLGM